MIARKPFSKPQGGAPVVFALLAVLAAAIFVGVSTTRWASSAIDLQLSEPLIPGLGTARPERPLVGATPTSSCASFRGGFATLAQGLGDTMGVPLECPHTDASTGDTLQRTSTGLAILRQHSQTPSFTDGHRRWALDARGIIAWEGEALDPPE